MVKQSIKMMENDSLKTCVVLQTKSNDKYILFNIK